MIFLLRRGGRSGGEGAQRSSTTARFARVTRDELVRLARDCGALDEARALAERYAEAARGACAFEPSPYREAL